MDKLLRVSDLQQIFRCGKNRAYQIVNSKGFPKIKIGKNFYISEDALNEWIKLYAYKEFKI